MIYDKHDLIELTRKAREEVRIEKVLAYYNITMTKVGGNTFALCPFHSDNHPSASIYYKKNKLRCFVCNETYSTVDVVMKCSNLNNIFEAVKKVLEIGGIDISINYEENLKIKNNSHKNDIDDIDVREILDKYSKPKQYYQIDYLKRRGLFLYEKDIKQKGLIPINNILKYNNIEIRHNYYNDVNYIVYKFDFNKNGHLWEDSLNYDYFYISKKINTQSGDKFKVRNGGHPMPKFIMLNEEDVNQLEKNNIYITEGIENALSIVQGKMANAITLNSVSNTDTLIQIIEDYFYLLKDYRYVIATDCDDAGYKAREKLIKFFTKNNIKYDIYNVLYDFNKKYPNVNDVNDLWRLRFKNN